MNRDSASEEELWDEPLFQQFTQESFSQESFVALGIGDSVLQAMDNIRQCMVKIDTEIHKQVVTRRDELVSQSAYIHRVFTELKDIQERVSSVNHCVQRVEKDIMQPYDTLRSSTHHLEKLTCVQHALKLTQRVLQLQRRLTDLQSRTKDLPRAALCVRELESILRSPQLSGVRLIDTKRRAIHTDAENLRMDATDVLHAAIDSVSQPDVALALQVFYNLGHKELYTCVCSVVNRAKGQVTQALRKALDLSALDNQSSSSSSSWRSALWGRVDGFARHCCHVVLQVWHLEQVICVKTDPTTHESFRKVLQCWRLKNGSEDSIIREFWTDLSVMLREELGRSSQESSFIHSVFVNEYPRLFAALTDIFDRVEAATAGAGDECAVRGAELYSQILSSVTPFEQAFLSRSLSRLNDPVHLMFSAIAADAAGPRDTGRVPTQADVRTLVSAVHVELSSVCATPNLQPLVAKGTVKAVLLLASHAERLMESSPPTSLTTSTAPLEKANTEIFNVLHTLRMQLLSLGRKIPDLTPEMHQALQPGIDALDGVCSSIVERRLQLHSKRLEACVLAMHDSDFHIDGADQARQSQGSFFARDLCSHAATMVRSVLNSFQASPVLDDALRTLCRRVIALFVRHASLLCPLSPHGVHLLCSDARRVSSALGALLRSPHPHPLPTSSGMGNGKRRRGYVVTEGEMEAVERDAIARPLAALSQLLRVPAASLLECEAVSLLQPSVVFQHLVSRAVTAQASAPGTPVLHSPAHSLGWSVEKYSRWVDGRSEREVLGILEGVLEKAMRSTSSAAKQHAPLVLAPSVRPFVAALEQLSQRLHAPGGELCEVSSERDE